MERKTGSTKRNYVFGEDTMSCPGRSCALFRAYTQPNDLHGWGREAGRERALLRSLLSADCSICFRGGTRVCSRCALPIRSKLQSDGWDEDGWCDGNPWLCGSPGELDGTSLFQQRGTRAPAASSAPLPRPSKAQPWSAGTQTYQPGVHASKVYNSPTPLTGNCLAEFIVASVRLKDTFLDPHVNYMNTPTFFSVPDHRRGTMIFFD